MLKKPDVKKMRQELLVFNFKFVIFVSLLVSIVHAKDSPCYSKEINPRTEVPYSSAQEWQNDVLFWKSQSHSQLNVFLLYGAYQIYHSEKTKADSFGNDKMAHCYMGCKISQGTSYKTARYVAWLKEMQDLTDCNPNSHFEFKDYEATIRGADAGKTKSTQCEAVCPSLIQNL